MKRIYLKAGLAAGLTVFAMSGATMVYASGQNTGTSVPLETWAAYNDNQKYLSYAMEEIEEEITGVFEYLGNMYMADGSRQIVDLLFIEAPEAEDGIYIYDIVTGELYDHINQKKVAEEFETVEHCINTLANSYQNLGNGNDIMWMDSEIIIRMSEEEIQAVLNGEVIAADHKMPDEQQEEAAPAPLASMEELLSQAVEVNAIDINNASFENMARAKQTYCGEVLKLKGSIQSIEDDHIVLGSGSTYVVDVYLSMDEIVSVEVGQQVEVVGAMSEEVLDSEQNIAEYTFEYVHYQMPGAYLVNDRFVINGKLKGENASYAPAFNIQIGDSNVLKLIYFSEDVDTASLEFNQEITFEAKCVKDSLDWEYLDAVIME